MQISEYLQRLEGIFGIWFDSPHLHHFCRDIMNLLVSLHFLFFVVIPTYSTVYDGIFCIRNGTKQYELIRTENYYQITTDYYQITTKKAVALTHFEARQQPFYIFMDL